MFQTLTKKKKEKGLLSILFPSNLEHGRNAFSASGIDRQTEREKEKVTEQRDSVSMAAQDKKNGRQKEAEAVQSSPVKITLCRNSAHCGAAFLRCNFCGVHCWSTTTTQKTTRHIARSQPYRRKWVHAAKQTKGLFSPLSVFTLMDGGLQTERKQPRQ